MIATNFIHDLRFENLPAEIVARAKLCLLDLLGVAAAGRSTELSRIVHGHAVRHMAAGEGAGARLLFDGRRASPAGPPSRAPSRSTASTPMTATR